MARIIIGSWMVRYPLGGNLSWTLQYLVGLKELGHDIYFVEKYAYDDSCFDPVRQEMTNDCTYGLKVVSELLANYGFTDRWCFVEKGDIYHGLSKQQVNELFRTADLYIDLGAHNAWSEESLNTPLRIYIDVDPAYTQIKLHHLLVQGDLLPPYDRYYTIGKNVGKPGNIIPTAEISWNHIINPVSTSVITRNKPPVSAAYTTVMNWKSYNNVKYKGIIYGQKDIEFEKFKSLPGVVNVPMEVAVSNVRKEVNDQLLEYGWSTRSAHEVTISFDSFKDYLSNSRGEFSVCKNIYVATDSGWFSDKSAAYMACGRPVVVQETGFSNYLPVGEGLFAVDTVDEAQEAIETIESNYQWHCDKAYEIACEYLEAKKVLRKFLDELGL